METALQTIIHPAASRGFADHGWLQARHSFSFAGFYDPDRMGFGTLRVLNDDIIHPNRGFGMHPHRDMEIITIPLEGTLRHKDNMGNEGTITRNEVQVMSAGRGVYHSEYNDSKTEGINLLQIWITPNRGGVEPRYGQQKFDPSGRKNKWQQLVSPDKEDEGLWIHQRAWISLADIDKGNELKYKVHHQTGQGLYIFVIGGSLEVEGHKLGKRDAVGLTGSDEIGIKASEGAEVLLLEVPLR